MEKIYYDKDADLKYLTDKVIGLIGYGIQGRAQALNIRDSGLSVLVANRADAYADQARQDGFFVHSIDELAGKSDIILFLIPDQAQAEVYEKSVKGFLRPGSMLVFAHGYALRYETIKAPDDIDIGMLAPRMPGAQIRDYFLKGSGVPAFVDVVQDKTSLAWERILALSKAAGFTRSGVLKVSYKVEAELDLFMEQFLVAAVVKAIHTGFSVLVNERHYPPVAVLMELYASGELSEVLRMAARLGIGRVFQKNASPTCQYGIASHFSAAMGSDPESRARRIIKKIQDGTFAEGLEREGSDGYRMVQRFWDGVNSGKITKAQEWINRHVRQKGE